MLRAKSGYSKRSAVDLSQVMLLLAISIMLLALPLFISRDRIIPSRAASGIPRLSIALSPASPSQGQSFDLILQVNPNNTNVKNFTLFVKYDRSKVELQDSINPNQNITSPHQLNTAFIDTVYDVVVAIGSKSGIPMSGSSEYELVRVKMRVKAGATGSMYFAWGSNSGVDQGVPRELADASFPIVEPTITPGPASSDLYLDLPGVQLQPNTPFPLTKGQNLDVGVYLKTGASQIISLDFILPYDDGRLTFQNLQDLPSNIEINPASGFNTDFVVRKVDTANKRVLIALVAPVINQAPFPVLSSSPIQLATVKFRVKSDSADGPFDLVPDTQSLIFDINYQKVINCVGGIHFTVVSTPTLTPANTPAATATIMPTATLFPSSSPVPTFTPTPTSAYNVSNLQFKLRLPDVTAVIIPYTEVELVLMDGDTIVDTEAANLYKVGDYYETLSGANFGVIYGKHYTLLIKTRTSIRRIFAGVYLSPSQSLDCRNTGNYACGELASGRDYKLLLSGDSDGFNQSSGSYNRIDSVDLHSLSIYFNQWAFGLATGTDFNLDGAVDIRDLDIFGKNYGQSGD